MHTAVTLPNELVAVVVDKLALLPREESLQYFISCSLVSRVFASLCQRHIFHSIRLFPRTSQRTTQEIQDIYQRTTLLTQTLIQNPLLGAYVRCIDYRLTAYPEAGDKPIQEVFSALESIPSRLPGVALRFELGYQDPRLPLHANPGLQWDLQLDHCPGRQWINQVSDTLQRLQVNILRLKNVRQFPLDSIPRSVEHLVLECVEILRYKEIHG
jgi:hypothetical protein